MMSVYVSLVLNMLATWLWFVLDEKHTERVFKLGKWVIPPLTVVLFLIGSLL
jgi:predicted Co/Zn/Cd cation transporter (cation efflux family)